MIEKAVKEFPTFKVTATTLRVVKSATINDWGAICWAGGKFYEATNRQDLEILDRVDEVVCVRRWLGRWDTPQPLTPALSSRGEREKRSQSSAESRRRGVYRI